jgi:hypothetical protein
VSQRYGPICLFDDYPLSFGSIRGLYPAVLGYLRKSAFIGGRLGLRFKDVRAPRTMNIVLRSRRYREWNDLALAEP